MPTLILSVDKSTILRCGGNQGYIVGWQFDSHYEVDYEDIREILRGLECETKINRVGLGKPGAAEKYTNTA